MEEFTEQEQGHLVLAIVKARFSVGWFSAGDIRSRVCKALGRSNVGIRDILVRLCDQGLLECSKDITGSFNYKLKQRVREKEHMGMIDA